VRGVSVIAGKVYGSTDDHRQELPMSTSASIDVERQEGWLDRARPYKVIIDGQRAGTVGHGQQQSFEVVPGAHEVFLKLDWCRSPKLTVDVASGERAKVNCAAGGNFWMTFFDVIF
jgi:hypothetical protein